MPDRELLQPASLQLTLDPDEPGYYSWWANGPGCGVGAVSWFESHAAAVAHALASFDRGYRSWKPENRPTCTSAEARLLVAGEDRGSWISLPDDIRYPHGKDAPWFPHRTQITDRKASA